MAKFLYFLSLAQILLLVIGNSKVAASVNQNLVPKPQGKVNQKEDPESMEEELEVDDPEFDFLNKSYEDDADLLYNIAQLNNMHDIEFSLKFPARDGKNKSSTQAEISSYSSFDEEVMNVKSNEKMGREVIPVPQVEAKKPGKFSRAIDSLKAKWQAFMKDMPSPSTPPKPTTTTTPKQTAHYQEEQPSAQTTIPTNLGPVEEDSLESQIFTFDPKTDKNIENENMTFATTNEKKEDVGKSKSKFSSFISLLPILALPFGGGLFVCLYFLSYQQNANRSFA